MADHAKLLAATQDMLAKSVAAREQHLKHVKDQLEECEAQLKAADSTIYQLRHNRASPKYAENVELRRHLLVRQTDLKDKVRRLEEDPAHDDLARMQEAKAMWRATSRAKTARLKDAIAEAQALEAEETTLETKHNKFVALGPSDPSLLLPPGTRFDRTRFEKPWKAVPEGGDFGYTPPPPRRHSMKETATSGASGTRAASVAGTTTVASSHDTSKSASRLPSRTQSAKTRTTGVTGTEADLDKPRNVYAAQQKEVPWKAVGNIGRQFSVPDYNRPATAHERKMATKLCIPDRHNFKPAMSGVTAWLPTSNVSRTFSPLVLLEAS